MLQLLPERFRQIGHLVVGAHMMGVKPLIELLAAERWLPPIGHESFQLGKGEGFYRSIHGPIIGVSWLPTAQEEGICCFCYNRPTCPA